MGFTHCSENKMEYLLMKFIREKDHETYTLFSAVVGGKHKVELAAFNSAPQILFSIYFACWLYLIPRF